ncbi:MAG TPA: nucleoside diphosphate kinase regulator [Reyranella sp.]|nr:nucleoside diphosphate kinase regulator [Reyranella sp.]
MATATQPLQGSGLRPPIHLLENESDILANLALQMEHRIPVVSAMLLTEIDRAEIDTPATLPDDVVTLGSTVSYWDEGSNVRRTVQIVLPAHADIEAGRISVLTPVGAGLIGLSAGQTIEWPDLEGRERRITIMSVRQPPRLVA